MSCFIFAIFMNNKMIISPFNSDNCNIANNTIYYQIIRNITSRILRLGNMVKEDQYGQTVYSLLLLLLAGSILSLKPIQS